MTDGVDVNELDESVIAAADAEPVEGVRYRVTYIELSMGIERTMTARFGGRTRFGDRWLPLWVLDPADQSLHGAGPIGPVLRAELLDAGGSEP